MVATGREALFLYKPTTSEPRAKKMPLYRKTIRMPPLFSANFRKFLREGECRSVSEWNWRSSRDKCPAEKKLGAVLEALVSI